MSSVKRKRAPPAKSSAKKSKKKEQHTDTESDLSDSSDIETNCFGGASGVGGGGGGIGGGGGAGGPQPDEVLIVGHGDGFDEPSQLPEELLKTLIKPSGALLFFGSVNWDSMGMRPSKDMKTKIKPNLYDPHRFTELRYRLAVSGCVAFHGVLVTESGKPMTFGRNKFGQLGLGHTNTVDTPEVVPTLENMSIIGAACGRNHTLFLTDTGSVYACGDNSSGQCGVGSNQPTIMVPTRINYRGPPIVKVGCGEKFSVILDVKGGLHSFGLPEYGQLGHNTDGKYFKTSTKLSFNFETSPKRIVLYIEKSKDGHVAPCDVTEIVDFNCGQNHTVAIDAKRRVFSWGFGGFGRLGHAEQKDEMVPRLIKYFDVQSRGVRSVFCGSTYTLAVSDIGVLFMFGQTKRTGEANMYPKPVQDLQGWHVNTIGAGNTSVIVSADDSLISWGSSPTYGELGLGEYQKSSTTPKEVTKLGGLKAICVTMGYGFTLVTVKDETEEEKTKLETFDTVDFDP